MNIPFPFVAAATAKRLLAITTLCLMLAPAARAECAASPAGFPLERPFTYYGHLSDGRKFGATLVYSGDDGASVRGRVFIGPRYEDIPVLGNIRGRTEVTLTSTKDGATVFQGSFLESPDGLSKFECQELKGSIADVGPATFALYHSMASLEDPELDTRNSVALAVHDAILSGNSRELAKHIHYPISLLLGDDTRHPLIIKNAAEFRRKYGEIVGPRLKELVRNEVPHDIFCRDIGCMMVNGMIWFNDEYQITHILAGN